MRMSSYLAVALLVAFAPFTTSTMATEVSGTYLETRTCQVYTGPCFANAEVGLAGRDAIMAWNISEGSHNGVDLTGLSVVMVLNASETIGFGGLDKPKEMKSIVLVDEKASKRQQTALISFAKQHGGRAGTAVVRVDRKSINMSLDTVELNGKLTAGKEVVLNTRKARLGDCICSNESAYYPPLAKIDNFAPGVTLQGEFKGRGLGTQWSTPGARSAYMGTFAY